ncbi:MAG TPA: hypothetical protein VFS30_09955 [Dehalococcoidia bacterium]|nr:hypothetical protein [Dehalococcoidia bacterium]
MIALSRSSRRRAQLLLRRTLRIGQHHYGSFVTVALLSGTLVVALTSSSFTGHTASDQPSPAPPASRIQLPPDFRTAIPPVGDARITYYLYEDEEQRALLTDILRRDFTTMSRMGLPNYIGEVHFLRVSNQQEEDYAAFLVNDVAAWAKTGGLTVSIVDLR